MARLKPFILDCDTGRDDALAIWLALLLRLPLKAIVTSYGNTTLKKALRNTAGVLTVAGRTDIPLFAGAFEPSRLHTGYDTIVLPRQAACGNGLCNIDLPVGMALPSPFSPAELAVNVKKLFDQHGPLDYIILGPATNLVSICKALGDDAKKYFGTIFMGGSKFDALWAQVPGADFNVIADPYAVNDLLKSGFEVRFVPMDVLFPVFSYLEDIENFRPVTELARRAQEIMIAHCRNFSPTPIFRYIDPATIMACMHSEGFRATTLFINIDECSTDYARLTENREGYGAWVYEADDYRKVWFAQEILKKLGLNQAF
jgi:purine nucleosidase